jgi:hypothetical protein
MWDWPSIEVRSSPGSVYGDVGEGERNRQQECKCRSYPPSHLKRRSEGLLPVTDRVLLRWADSYDLDLLDDKEITDKAEELGVSVQALSIRLDRLGLLRLDYFV